MGDDPGLAASPPARNNLEVGRGWYSPFRVSAVDKLCEAPPRRRSLDHHRHSCLSLTLSGNLGAVDPYL